MGGSVDMMVVGFSGGRGWELEFGVWCLVFVLWSSRREKREREEEREGARDKERSRKATTRDGARERASEPQQRTQGNPTGEKDDYANTEQSSSTPHRRLNASGDPIIRTDSSGPEVISI
jgi:hypothetical protein